MTGPWRVQDRIQKEGKVGFVNKCWIPLKHYLIKLSAPEKSWVMLSTSFSAVWMSSEYKLHLKLWSVWFSFHLHFFLSNSPALASSLVCLLRSCPSPHLPSIITAETIWEHCLLRTLFQQGYYSPAFPLLSFRGFPVLPPASLSSCLRLLCEPAELF